MEVFLQCKVDTDCIAIHNPVCCTMCLNLVAVNKQYAANYTQDFACKTPPPFPCPLACIYQSPDSIAICDDTNMCHMEDPRSLQCGNTNVVIMPPKYKTHICPAPHFLCSTEFTGGKGLGMCEAKVPCKSSTQCEFGQVCLDDPMTSCKGKPTCPKICGPDLTGQYTSCGGSMKPPNNTCSAGQVCVNDPRAPCDPMSLTPCPGICAPDITLCKDTTCGTSQKCIVCGSGDAATATCVSKRGGKCPTVPTSSPAGPAVCSCIKTDVCMNCNGSPICVPAGSGCPPPPPPFCNKLCIKGTTCQICNGKSICAKPGATCAPTSSG